MGVAYAAIDERSSSPDDRFRVILFAGVVRHS
jgi:hypothetical protein